MPGFNGVVSALGLLGGEKLTPRRRFAKDGVYKETDDTGKVVTAAAAMVT
jgi:hypothetical protein